MKKIIVVLVAAIALLFAVFNLQAATAFLGKIWNALYPVFIGIIVALVFNSPVKFLEKKFLKHRKLTKIKRFLSVTITAAIIVGVFVGIAFLIAPDIKKSIAALADTLNNINADNFGNILGDSKLAQTISANLQQIVNSVADKLSDILPKAVELMQNMIMSVINLFLGIVFGMFIIMGKEKLVGQAYKVLRLGASEVTVRKFLAGVGAAAEKFSRFLSGQMLEAVIFGVMVYISLLIFKMPYIVIVSLVMALGNLIPMVGSYVSGGVAFVFIFSVSPEKALIFLIIIIVLQQLEQITTYPIIVGRYVGISAFWVLFAVVVGGGLFGFWGLVLGVPTVGFLDAFCKTMYSRNVQEST